MVVSLGIDNNPLVKTYSYHAFLNSIINSREVLNVNVADRKEYHYETVSYDTKIKCRGNLFSVCDDINTKNREGFIYRECNLKDELIVRINHMDMTGEHPILNLIISDGNPDDCIANDKSMYRMGIHRYGIMISYGNKIVEELSINHSNISWFRISYKRGQVTSSYSSDGKVWYKVCTVEDVCVNGKNNLKIGMNYNNLGSHSKDEEYFCWMYMNYFQLRYDRDESVSIPLDYYMETVKNFRYEAIFAYHYIDVDYLSMAEVSGLFNSVDEFIKYSIDNRYYVELCFDEFDIPKRSAYRQYHFYHHNLIYGYDDKKKVYMTVGYADKPVYSELAYDIIEKARIDVEADIIRIRHNKDKSRFQFDSNKFKRIIEEYIEGIASNERYVYGLKVLEELIHTERGRKVLICDIRVSYLIYEHCCVMRDRLVFMIARGELKSITYTQELVSECENMTKIARSVNLMVYKNAGDVEGVDHIVNELTKLYELEVKFYNRLIVIL